MVGSGTLGRKRRGSRGDTGVVVGPGVDGDSISNEIPEQMKGWRGDRVSGL